MSTTATPIVHDSRPKRGRHHLVAMQEINAYRTPGILGKFLIMLKCPVCDHTKQVWEHEAVQDKRVQVCNGERPFIDPPPATDEPF